MSICPIKKWSIKTICRTGIYIIMVSEHQVQSKLRDTVFVLIENNPYPMVWVLSLINYDLCFWKHSYYLINGIINIWSFFWMQIYLSILTMTNRWLILPWCISQLNSSFFRFICNRFAWTYWKPQLNTYILLIEKLCPTSRDIS